jgi:hypothetical protein
MQAGEGRSRTTHVWAHGDRGEKRGNIQGGVCACCVCVCVSRGTSDLSK